MTVSTLAILGYNDPMQPNQTLEEIKRVKTNHEAQLMRLANVVGVGIGFKEKNGQLTDRLALIVNVTQKKPLAELATEDIIPLEIDGVSTDVQEVGQMRAL